MDKKGIIITGGAQGIGKITTQLLLKNNYLVCVFDNDKEALGELVNDLPDSNLYTFTGDVSVPGDVKNGVEYAAKIFNNCLSGVVNNAAIAINKPLYDLRFEEWKRVLGVNLDAVFLMAKLTSHMLKRNKGSIVNIASTRAIMSEPGTEAYSASKGGVLSLTHALAASLGPEIRVNAVSPGWIETRHLQKKKVMQNITHRAGDKEQHLVGRVGEASDIAEMIIYLLSEKAGFITGQNFIIDGGMTKKMIYL